MIKAMLGVSRAAQLTSRDGLKKSVEVGRTQLWDRSAQATDLVVD